MIFLKKFCAMSIYNVLFRDMFTAATSVCLNNLINFSPPTYCNRIMLLMTYFLIYFIFQRIIKWKDELLGYLPKGCFRKRKRKSVWSNRYFTKGLESSGLLSVFRSCIWGIHRHQSFTSNPHK